MILMTDALKRRFEKSILPPVIQGKYPLAVEKISEAIDELYAAIPDKQRISCGIHSVLRELGQCLYEGLQKEKADVFGLSVRLAEAGAGGEEPQKIQGVAVKILTCWMAGDPKQFTRAFPYIEQAAASEDWVLREHTAGFFRNVIRAHPQAMQTQLMDWTASSDSNLRRFVSETLRPVADGKWLTRQPEYSLAVLRRLFKEKAAYPRTSVGNNLSDLARSHPEKVYTLVEELANSGDENSYWIAYRACRNLVKKEPERVMKLLKVREYHYKNRNFKLKP